MSLFDTFILSEINAKKSKLFPFIDVLTNDTNFIFVFIIENHLLVKSDCLPAIFKIDFLIKHRKQIGTCL